VLCLYWEGFSGRPGGRFVELDDRENDVAGDIVEEGEYCVADVEDDDTL
jgi:hypothetical protein